MNDPLDAIAPILAVVVVMSIIVPCVTPPAGDVHVIIPSPVRKLPALSQPLSVKLITTLPAKSTKGTNANSSGSSALKPIIRISPAVSVLVPELAEVKLFADGMVPSVL